MKIDYFQALKQIPNAKGIWVMYGQEPLLEQNLLDAFRQHWLQQDIERQRFDISSVSDWEKVFESLDSLSLFSNRLAVEVHGNIKPDAARLKYLKNYLQQNNDNLLLVILPKQESSTLKSAFFQTADANGTLIALQANFLKDQQRILHLEAEKIGIQLQAEAWHWLLQHHEHNLLAAKNSLIRVSDTFPEKQLFEANDLMSCLQDQSRYTVYDLSDAILKADLANAIKILQFLIESDEALTLILWVISKEAHLLLQLYEQPHQAAQLGIWKNRIPLYQQAVKRLNPNILLNINPLLLRTDQAIKGINQENPIHLFQQLLAILCGKNLFN